MLKNLSWLRKKKITLQTRLGAGWFKVVLPKNIEFTEINYILSIYMM